MANHKSAIKAHRQSLARRDRNRYHRARLRTAIKNYRKAIEGGDKQAVGEMLTGMLSMVDRSAKLGAIHGNVADRTKSRLTRAYNRIAASA